MKRIFSIFCLFLLIAGIPLAGCQNSANTGTVQVNDEYGGGCEIVATLDNGSPVTLTGAYNFTLVQPGIHTLRLSTSGGVSGGTCGFTNSSTYSTSCSVTVSAGVLYAATLLEGASNNIISITCPN